MGRPLAEDEVSYLSALAYRYLGARLPDLPDGPSPVPRRRREGTVHPLPTSRRDDAAANAASPHPQAS